MAFFLSFLLLIYILINVEAKRVSLLHAIAVQGLHDVRVEIDGVRPFDITYANIISFEVDDYEESATIQIYQGEEEIFISEIEFVPLSVLAYQYEYITITPLYSDDYIDEQETQILIFNSQIETIDVLFNGEHHYLETLDSNEDLYAENGENVLLSLKAQNSELEIIKKFEIDDPLLKSTDYYVVIGSSVASGLPLSLLQISLTRQTMISELFTLPGSSSSSSDVIDLPDTITNGDSEATETGNEESSGENINYPIVTGESSADHVLVPTEDYSPAVDDLDASLSSALEELSSSTSTIGQSMPSNTDSISMNSVSSSSTGISVDDFDELHPMTTSESSSTSIPLPMASGTNDNQSLEESLSSAIDELISSTATSTTSLPSTISDSSLSSTTTSIASGPPPDVADKDLSPDAEKGSKDKMGTQSNSEEYDIAQETIDDGSNSDDNSSKTTTITIVAVLVALVVLGGTTGGAFFVYQNRSKKRKMEPYTQEKSINDDVVVTIGNPLMPEGSHYSESVGNKSSSVV